MKKFPEARHCQILTANNRYFNRELSWLKFNERVLEEGENMRPPLLERLRFLSITGSNLDEFFMIRIGDVRDLARDGETALSPDGFTPAEEMDLLKLAVEAQLERQQALWRHLKKRMDAEGIRLLAPDELEASEQDWLSQELGRRFPNLAPVIIEAGSRLPFIPNKGLALVFEFEDPDQPQRPAYALLPLPADGGRFIRLPDRENRDGQPEIVFVTLESAVAYFSARYAAGREIVHQGWFRVLRDSDLEFDERAEDSLLPIEKLVASALKKRREGEFIRLDAPPSMPDTLRDFVVRTLGFEASQVFIERDFIGVADVSQLIVKERPELQYVPYEGRFPERVRDYHNDCFAAIRAKDILVHHPYETFDVVLGFLRQAADDPAVEVIKWTLYRTSRTDQRLVEALKDAAKARKSVTAFIELKARFDEELNLRISEEMIQAGVRVEYGFAELKTHAKLGMVARWEDGKLNTYCHLGTGNYHPLTAKIYTDLSIFTSDKTICGDVARVFNALAEHRVPSGLAALSNSPHGIRERVIQHIDEEIAHAKAGRPAAIWMKMNALVDVGVIDKLYEASNAGVEIKLVIRGMCCLVPGVRGQSENIYVKSVIGRFLEHSRIYCFGNGHGLPSDEAFVYISSADLMPRNLDRRVEVMAPVTNDTVHEQILGQIMVAMLKDNQQSWRILPDGGSRRIQPRAGDEHFNAHEYFMRNPSLSGRGESLKYSAPPELHV
jgi:polyphosphate kinase